MGCGRSTMGSDSPTGNSNKDEDGQTVAENPTKCPPSNSVHGHVIPFSPGGPLLAQAKISESQMDFFKILDNKIESGPDLDSEDELIEKSHLQQCLLQQKKKHIIDTEESSRGTGAPLNKSVVISKGATAEEEMDTCSEVEKDPCETVKEQYMFMGNLYTLTRLNTDGGTKPQHVVDVSPAPRRNVDESSDTVAPIVASKDVLTKVNGTSVKSVSKERGGRGILQRTDTPFHGTVIPKKRVPPRPASLVLRTIFPTKDT